MIGRRHGTQADIRNVYTVFHVDKLERINQGNETKGSINGQKFWQKPGDSKTDRGQAFLTRASVVRRLPVSIF